MSSPIFLKDIIKDENSKINAASTHELFTQVYVIDTNILRTFLEFYLPQDIFPEIWNGFNKLIQLGLITSVDDVMKECMEQIRFEAGIKWIEEHTDLFAEPDDEEIKAKVKITSYNEFQLTPKEISGNKTKADLFIVAKGLATGGIVVSSEKYAPHGRKIPTMAERFNVPYLYIHDFIRVLRIISSTM